MEASERKAASKSDPKSWRRVRALVGQLVNAKAVVDELVRMQALDEDAQDTFMNAVLHDEHLQAHPPSSKYLKSLLRLYAREIDNADEALSDSFANELAIYNQSSTGDEPHSNTCFFVAEDCVVRCRAAIEHNDVGLRIWEAGLLLTELVSHYRKQFAHKRVLELGAGLGLTSLCAAVVEPAHIFISDYSLPTLANIRYNIELNALHPGARAEDLQLNWCTMTQDTAQDLDPDIILAADTVYDRQFIPAFCDTLKHFASAMPEAKRQTCTPPSTSTTARSAGIDWTVKPVILIAATLRNPDTFAAFMRALSERGVVAVNLSDVLKAEVPQQLHYGFRDLIQVLQVFAAPSES